MADRKPLKVLPDGGGDSTGLAEFVAADTIGVVDGGTGLATVATDNILTGNGTSALSAESNLTFTGSALTCIGTAFINSGATRPIAEFTSSHTNRMIVVSADTETADDTVGIAFNATASSAIGSTHSIAAIEGKVTQAGTLKGDLIFHVNAGDSYTESMRLDSAGNLLLGGTPTTTNWTASGKLFIEGAIPGIGLRDTTGSADDFMIVNSNGVLTFANDTENTQPMRIDEADRISMGYNGTLQGRLQIYGAYTAPASGIGLSAAFLTSSNGLAANVGGVLQFGGSYNTGGDLTQWAAIQGLKTNASSSDVSGYLSFITRSNSAGIQEHMRLRDTGQFAIGATAATAQSGLVDIVSPNNNQTLYVVNQHTGFTSHVTRLGADKSANSNYIFLDCQSDMDGSNTREFNLRGDGNGYARAGFHTGSGDYAEFFESTDGTALEVGKAVVLDGDKIRIYSADSDSADNILGVTRPKADGKVAAVVGNAAWSHWTDKYLTDDWGVYIREDIKVWEWDAIAAVEAQEAVLYTEDDEVPDGKSVGDVKTAAVEAVEGRKSGTCYERNALAKDADWPPPNGATSSMQSVRKLNPEYSVEVDDETNYSPRADRDEWNQIGLLGQVQIKANEPTRPTWIKMKNISDAVELWMIR